MNFDYIVSIIFTLITSMNFIFGSLFNTLFLLNVYRHRSLRQTKFFGIISLSMVDLLMCFVVSPLLIVRELSSSMLKLGLNKYMCASVTFLATWAGFSSIFSLTFIAFERYFVFKTNHHLNRCKFLASLTAAHLFSFVLGIFHCIILALANSSIFVRCCSKNNNNNHNNETTSQSIILYLNEDLFLDLFTLKRLFNAFYLSIGVGCLFIIIYCYSVIYKIIRTKRLLRIRLNAKFRQSLAAKADENGVEEKENENQQKEEIKQQQTQNTTFKFKFNNKEYKIVMLRLPLVSKQQSSSSSSSSTIMNRLSFSFKPNRSEMINYQLRLNELVYGDESISTNNQEAASAAAAAAAAADDSASSSTQFRITAFNREQQKSEEINFGTSMLEKKAIRKTIMPTLAFFFLWIPFVLVQSISLFANFNNNFIDKANLIAMSIAYLHSTINPIIYSFTNKEINKTIMAKSNRNAHI